MRIRYVFCAFFVAILSISPTVQSANAELICSQSPERYFDRMEKASDWFDAAKQVVTSEGLSVLWLYLMLAESGGNKDAVSKQGAVGPWQLTSLIAKSFGCDDRKDPVKSTKAAVKYLKKLIADFKGDTQKVIQAYNMGGSNLKRLGKPTAEAKHLSQVVMCLFEKDPLELSQK